MEQPLCTHCGTAMDLYDTVRMVIEVHGRYRCSNAECEVCGGRCTERHTAMLPAA